MESIDIARTVLLLMAGLLLAGPGSTTERMPPADHCLDARQVTEVFQSDGHTLAVATAGGARYRVPLMLATGRPPDMMMTGSDRLQNLGAKLGCPISAVYPVGT